MLIVQFAIVIKDKSPILLTMVWGIFDYGILLCYGTAKHWEQGFAFKQFIVLFGQYL